MKFITTRTSPPPGVAPHSHSFYEFYFLLEGQVLMTIQDRPYTVTPGNIIMIPPGAVHFPALKEPGLPYARFVLWIHKDYYRKRLASGEVFRYLFDGCNTLDAPVLTISQPLFNDLQSRIFSLIREGTTTFSERKAPADCFLHHFCWKSAGQLTAGSTEAASRPHPCAAESAPILMNIFRNL